MKLREGIADVFEDIHNAYQVATRADCLRYADKVLSLLSTADSEQREAMDDNESFKAALTAYNGGHPVTHDTYTLHAFSSGWIAHRALTRPSEQRDDLKREVREESAALTLAENEVALLRDTVSSLNRRCQAAESAATENVEACRREGLSLGRSLANWAATKAGDEVADLRRKLERVEMRAGTQQKVLEYVHYVLKGTNEVDGDLCNSVQLAADRIAGKLEQTAKGSHAYADDCEILRDEVEDLRRKLERAEQDKRDLETIQQDIIDGALKDTGQQVVELRRKLEETDSTLGNCREGYEAATEAIAELNEELNEANAKLAASSLANAALRSALVYKPHGSYNSCRLCGQTWWDDKPPNHSPGCVAALALPADSLAQEVVKYTRHDPGCNLLCATSEYDNGTCTCGLDALLARIGGQSV